LQSSFSFSLFFLRQDFFLLLSGYPDVVLFKPTGLLVGDVFERFIVCCLVSHLADQYSGAK
jgi:hypothetical protein